MRALHLLGLMTGMLIAFSANAEEQLGAHFFGQTMPSSSTQTIFAAAANVQGASIRSVSIWSTDNGEIALQASYPDGTQRMIFVVLASPSQSAFGNLSNPIRLPAGVGLSAISMFGASPIGAGVVDVTYDLY
jgi:hypothetical protein